MARQGLPQMLVTGMLVPVTGMAMPVNGMVMPVTVPAMPVTESFACRSFHCAIKSVMRIK